MARTSSPTANGPGLGIEESLWRMADALRGHMDAAEYKHVVLGLIFLKYISDAFEVRHQQLLAEEAEGADPENPEEYQGFGVFWVPKSARWDTIKSRARFPDIGTAIDAAMSDIEKHNSSLRDVLPKGYQRPTLNKQQLGDLVELVTQIGFGTDPAKQQDIIGRV